MLDLSNNIMESSEEICELPSIQYLYLNGNELNSWIVGRNTQMLKELWIDNNHLKIIRFEGSKDCIEKISARYYLSLNIRFNIFDSIENFTHLRTLKELYLDNNRIKSINGFFNCESLRILSLKNNKIEKYFKY